MTADELQAYQDDVLKRLAVALSQTHGIELSLPGFERADIARFVTDLLEDAPIPSGRAGYEIALLIDAWIELDDLTRTF